MGRLLILIENKDVGSNFVNAFHLIIRQEPAENAGSCRCKNCL
jgi:hypothetical protein